MENAVDPSVGLDRFVYDARARIMDNHIERRCDGGAAAMLQRFGYRRRPFGIEISYVPVSGGVGKMMPMLAGKHVHAGVTSSSHAVKHKATVNTLVIAGDSPCESLPGVPNEAGWTYTTTWGVMAPPGTPPEIIAKLYAALNKATPPVKAIVVKNGLTPMSQTPEQAKAFIKKSIAEN